MSVGVGFALLLIYSASMIKHCELLASCSCCHACHLFPAMKDSSSSETVSLINSSPRNGFLVHVIYHDNRKKLIQKLVSESMFAPAKNLSMLGLLLLFLFCFVL